MAHAPFRFTITKASDRLFEIEYVGYMSEDMSHVVQTEKLVSAVTKPVGLYYDVAEFSGFHRSQVQKHGELFIRLGPKVTGIAVVAARPVVRFGAVTVSLISKTPLKTFDGRKEALDWLDSLR